MSALLDLSRLIGAERAVSLGQPDRIARLTAFLRANFRATESVLGRDRFGELATAYLVGRRRPDTRASSHGIGFPDFVARSRESAKRPYIADLARLELAIRRARHSPIRAGRALEDLSWRARGGTEVLVDLQLSLQLVVLRWPVLDLWLQHQDGQSYGDETLHRQTCRLQIVNRDGDVAMRDLSPAAFALRHGLLAGYTLERAVERALRRDPFFDLVSELLALFDENLVVGIRRVAPSSSHAPS